jgi:uncharacterized protein YbjT (DUF2867 family)
LSPCKNIVVAGASGYIGRTLIPELLKKFPEASITALSRVEQKSDDPRIVWKGCDLFSLKSIEQALPAQVDLAVYLVHSMVQTAQLDQGSFADYDLILADNFSRSIRTRSLRHMIYLGGLIPEQVSLSRHLRSRLEVEQVFVENKLSVTMLRAGLILGDGGSSTQILFKLVRRLPVMLCPHWTQTETNPVDLETVIDAICQTAMDQSFSGKVFDLASGQSLTYLQMMRDTATRLGLKRYFFKVPFFTPTLSRLWVSLITNSPRELVYPLVESLEHPMLARPANRLPNQKPPQTYLQLLQNTATQTYPGRSLFQFKAQRNTVRSVQRLPLPSGRTAEWVKNEYIKWLPQFLSPLIQVTNVRDEIRFCLFSSRLTLLSLSLSLERSQSDRQLMYIKSGILVEKHDKGRLEFRSVLSNQYVIAAIHDFHPALPWFVYKYTQALMHLFVMKAFARHLRKQ